MRFLSATVCWGFEHLRVLAARTECSPYQSKPFWQHALTSAATKLGNVPELGGQQEVSIQKALSWPALTGVSWNVPRAPFSETSPSHRLGGGCFALWPKRDCSGGPK